MLRAGARPSPRQRPARSDGSPIVPRGEGGGESARRSSGDTACHPNQKPKPPPAFSAVTQNTIPPPIPPMRLLLLLFLLLPSLTARADLVVQRKVTVGSEIRHMA